MGFVREERRKQFAQWFRERVAPLGTEPKAAAHIGISLRQLQRYKAGQWPQPPQLALIEEAFGPFVYVDEDEQRLRRFEARLAELEQRVSALDGEQPGGGGRVPLDRAAARTALEKDLEAQPSPPPSSTGRRRRRGGGSSA